MKFRTAKNEDSDAIKKLVFGVLAEYGLTPDPGTTDKDLDDIEHYYHNNNGYFGVIEEENTIVASVGIIRMDTLTCELRKMYALPVIRGKGIGKQLLEYAIVKARLLGYKKVVLETASPLKEAISLYKHYGFKEYHPDHLSQRCDQAFTLDISATTDTKRSHPYKG